MVVLILLVFQLASFVASLEFSISTFPNDIVNNISHKGDAFIDGKFLRLTKSTSDNVTKDSVGRATYTQPLLLREKSTGKLADFTTNFTFVIDSEDRTYYADGLTFHLAPNGSTFNYNIGTGGSIGLPVVKDASGESTYLYPFVAVEFDILRNLDYHSILDPIGEHVGIDVNSCKSNVTMPWNGGIPLGKENTASISYNSSSKNLTVAFTTLQNVTNGTQVQVINYLSYIVDLKSYLPDWVIVGFTAAAGNQHSEEGYQLAVHKIVSWSFNTTALVDVDVPEKPSEQPKAGKVNIGLLLGLGVGGFLILVGALSLLCFIFCKRKAVGEHDENSFVNTFMDEELEKGSGPRKFSYRELVRATSNFKEEEKLGERGFGGVYRGYIKDLNSYVVVKRISSRSKQGLKEYASKVRIISRLRHRNLVQLIGWWHVKKELLLVYEFMSNGSLDSHLFNANRLLSWQARYKIAQGLASGLLYLHEEWEQCVLHIDIKSSNIMLDRNFNVKLGDFGLARLVDHGKQSQTTIVAGTRGYMALEYVSTGKASKESDVYSFGVVVLEIACGRKPIDLNLESSQIEMVEWVWELYGDGKVTEAADPNLYGHFDEKQMECLIIVGLWCAHPDYKLRPSIQEAIQVFNFEVPLPILPSTMPVATYFAPIIPVSTSSTYTIGSERDQTVSQDVGIPTIPHSSSHPRPEY